jgi:hypothetical protein
MQQKGINYDTGFMRSGAQSSRPSFDPAQVCRELEIIARDLHCNAVRISGRDPQRIALAARHALDQGLEVWFSPFPSDLTTDELVPYFAEHARLAEALRRESPRTVFVLGCEMSLFNRGFVPGATYMERIQAMMNPALPGGTSESPEQMQQRFNAFLQRAVAAVRRQFAGPITYASGAWEEVDWSAFDIVGVDHYRDASNQRVYREQLRPYFAHGRPVAVTEFGCCTYRGAADRGAMGWAIVDRSTQPPRLTEDVVRDEQVQASYLTDVLDTLVEEGVDSAFWFTFAGYGYPFSGDPRHDLDCASYGLVKILDRASGETYPGLPWEPKQAFHRLSERYARLG